jgi:hypothetical protein
MSILLFFNFVSFGFDLVLLRLLPGVTDLSNMTPIDSKAIRIEHFQTNTPTGVEEQEPMAPGTLFQAWLDKKAKNNRHLWQPRYFVLTATSLSYYTTIAEKRANKEPRSLYIRDINLLEVATEGKGSSEGRRLNIETPYLKLATMGAGRLETLQFCAAIEKARKLALRPEPNQTSEATNQVIEVMKREYANKLSITLAEEEKKRERQIDVERKQANLERLQLESKLRAEHERELANMKSVTDRRLQDQEARLKKTQEAETNRFLQDSKRQQERQKALEAKLQAASASTGAQGDDLIQMQAALAREREQRAVQIALEAERKRITEAEGQLAKQKQEADLALATMRNELELEYKAKARAFAERNSEEIKAQEAARRAEAERKERELRMIYEKEIAEAKKQVGHSGNEAKRIQAELDRQLADLKQSMMEQSTSEEAERKEREARNQLALRNKFERELMYVKQQVNSRLEEERAAARQREADLQREVEEERERLKAQLQVMENEKKLFLIKAKQANDSENEVAARAIEEKLKSAQAAASVQAALDKERESHRLRSAELEEARRLAEEQHRQQMQQLEEKLAREQEELVALRKEYRKKNQNTNRTFIVRLRNNTEIERTLGSVEVAVVGDLTLADLRKQILQELDGLPREWSFYLKEVPVGVKQEPNKLLVDLPDAPVDILRGLSSPAPPPPPPCPPTSGIAALAAPKPGIPGTSALSGPVPSFSGITDGLFDAIRKGKDLKKTSPAATKSPAAGILSAGGLTADIARALIDRRGEMDDDSDNEVNNDWD